MKKTKIIVHKTTEEPKDYTPFVMVAGSIFRAYNAGELNGEKILVFLMLSKKVNPHNGIGAANYAEIAAWLKLKTNEQSTNHVNKLMVELRDKNKLLWFSKHGGSRDFEYVIADYKLAKNSDSEMPKWVDIAPYFQSQEQTKSRTSEKTTPKPSSEPIPRHPPPEQRLERSNDEEFTSLKDVIRKRESRPPYTNTDS
ncbi:MAG: hypothetical protein RL641_448 [Candidatus Parcubacteria bacterium]|jgi:hypothetical protein